MRLKHISLAFGAPFSLKAPCRRSISLLAKLNGLQVSVRFPFLATLEAGNAPELNEILSFQHWRSGGWNALIVGAFDGMANDPGAAFTMQTTGAVVCVEPEPTAFRSLQAHYAGRAGAVLLNCAVDRVTSSRTMYRVKNEDGRFAEWVSQINSFERSHILKHSAEAPGIEAAIESFNAQTMTFDDIIDNVKVSSIDLLQIDAEGLDAKLIEWFPFARIKPGVVTYEITHMSLDELTCVRLNLERFGYIVVTAAGAQDDIALLT